jgi:uncharacterized protein (DUF1778 family)
MNKVKRLSTKTSVFQVRISQEERKQLEAVALMLNMTITDFVREAFREKIKKTFTNAAKIIEEN